MNPQIRTPTIARRIFFALAVLLGGPAHAAVTFTIAPSTVSNTYAGKVTLQVGGLTNLETVAIQKFLDVNTNGVIDARDWLAQQFALTDGQSGIVIGGVTNFNVPGDLNSTAGAITATLNFASGDFIQNFVGKSLFKLSSPAGRFTPITNSFTVTNRAFGQRITGSVVNRGTNVPNAVVVVMSWPQGVGLAGTVANNSGGYTLALPPGAYMLAPFRSDYVANFEAAAVVNLGSGQTIITNLSLTNATASIAGKVVDAGNAGVGLPGVMVMAQSADGFFAVGFTDTGGNFTLGVRSGPWMIRPDGSSLVVHGYLGLDDGPVVNAGTTGVTVGVPQATALVFGSVKDHLGNPMAGLDMLANDRDADIYETETYTDADGKYVVGTLAGDWYVGVAEDNSPTNYIFTGGQDVTLSAGQALLLNFTARLATNHISGYLKDSGDNPIGGVWVWASANINGTNYQVGAETEGSGYYSFNVSSGSWWVGVSCYGDEGLNSRGYQCVTSQQVVISGSDGTANFTAYPCSLSITTVGLPDGNPGAYYSAILQASGCYEPFGWSLAPGSNPLPPGLYLDAGTGAVFGYPTSAGNFNFIIRVTDALQNAADKGFSITITTTPLQIVSSSYLTATQGQNYTNQLAASGGQPPYSWALAPGSQPLPPNLALTANGVLSGVPVGAGVSYFIVRVTDTALDTADQSMVFEIHPQPLQIATTNLPDAFQGAAYSAQLVATGGYPPYWWTYTPGSLLLPPDLELYSEGQVTGTPATNGTFFFYARVTDSQNFRADRLLALRILSPLMLRSPSQPVPGVFQFLVEGTTGTAYTVEYSTNFDGWLTLLTTNPPVATFRVVDSSATNAQRLYRVVIGP